MSGVSSWPSESRLKEIYPLASQLRLKSTQMSYTGNPAFLSKADAAAKVLV
jgi:hypothetical protein